jgi:hypothetical protein
MALPKIDVPIYDVKLISTGKKVRFRPFTVKEEKLFLMASESSDSESIITAITQVLNNCVLDDVDIESLPLFDVEYLFLNLRARSISEVVNLKYKCNNKVTNEEGNEKKCNNEVQLDVNILEIEPQNNPIHTSKIELSSNLGIVMKYPKMSFMNNMDSKDEFDAILNIIVDCIDYIYDEDNVYYAKDTDRKELVEFVESLQSKDLDKIKQFFDTMPKMKKEVEFKCKKCGYNEKLELEGLQSFFG